MPDPVPLKRRPLPTQPRLTIAPPIARYAELHCKTNFSFLEGASHADELVVRAKELGYTALAVTDRNSLAGVVRAHVAAKSAQLKLLIGAEVTPSDAPPLVLWAPDRAAYGRLCRIITRGRRSAPKGEFRLAFAELAEHASGLLAGVLLATSHESGKSSFECHSERRAIDRFRELFRDRGYLIAELHRRPRDAEWLANWRRLSLHARLPIVAAGDVYYHARERLPLADALTAIRVGLTVDTAGEHLFPNAERVLKSPDEMAARFSALPEAVERACEIANRCSFSLDELRYEYPEELAPAGETPLEYLTRLTWAGAAERYPGGVPEKVRGLLEHELSLIAELGYEAYFLTVWDLVRFARGRGILCQGRGSAANSAVCYCLGVTAVDPSQIDLLFERFVSGERNEAPDIDIDFEHERREEVLQYLYDKYGRERAGLTAEVITYRPRSAIRDVGKALGYSPRQVDAIAKQIEGRHHESDLASRCQEAGCAVDDARGQRLLRLVNELVGFPRHLGQHVGGMVMTRGPLCELAPIENAAMENRTVIEWDKDDLDQLGILKVDCLALGMLSAIRKAFALIERHLHEPLTLANIPGDDPRVYDMICRADTMGVFQIESRAQMSMLPRLKPRTFYDLVIEVAIVRPGPIQGKMVHPYLRRRAGEEEVTFPNDIIRGVLRKTLGVPLFQEQAMRLAVVAAGFTPGEADQLRRAMGAWRRTGVIERFRQKLLDGMRQRGLDEEFATRLFEQIRGFGEYGFPESHAASFALLVYVSAWLKCHYPAVFAAALINSQPMGFYAPAQLVRNARERGVQVLPIDVNASDWDCTLEPASAFHEHAPRHSVSANAEPLAGAAPDPRRDREWALRLGLRLISGLSATHAERVVAARRRAQFQSLADLSRRAGLGRAVLKRLSAADALGKLAENRRQGVWQALAQSPRGESMPLFASNADDDEPLVALPEMTTQEEVIADYCATGLSLRAHPMQFKRSRLESLGVTPAVDLTRLPPYRLARVAGVVLVRQRPGTAKGITFMTLEDETGVVNLIVRQEIWRRYRQAARTAAALLASGRLQSKDGVIHLLVNKLVDLGALLGELRSVSRDFH